MGWIVREEGFDQERVVTNGNKYMIGNGYLGYRGTLEEFGKDQLQAVTLAGLYDRAGDKWREPVNAPNGLYVSVEAEGERLSALSSRLLEHAVELDIRGAVFRRRTVFGLPSGASIAVEAERFASDAQPHLLAMQYSITSSVDIEIKIRSGIDGDVWDINGPHLFDYAHHEADGVIGLSAVTGELGQPVAVAESLRWTGGDAPAERLLRGDRSLLREIVLPCKAGRTYAFAKYAAVYTGLDGEADPMRAAMALCRRSAADSYRAIRDAHAEGWARKWSLSDVEIDGDDEAQLALRYSLYQLLIIAPQQSEKVSIPARGLSGQVYKGAVFWDTEMFMLPFFLYTQPELARNLVMYRVHTLDGARRKAAEYGYRGAFYAWESQDSGDDACTLFNVTDVFTNRPMRTYFRDKQIHISADAAHGVWQYYLFTGDESVLWQGGADVILECARFFCSYAYYHPERDRYELLDVTGPDEYHERVHNNAFTNAMAHRTLDTALQTVETLRARDPQACGALLAKLDYASDLERVRHVRDRLYLPEPDASTGLIEQFDGYRRLEDVSLGELKGRMLNRNEYWGGGNGLATTTKIIKQADVVLLLHLFRDRYGQEIKRANWEYYEPRTEHGSSLSPCVYALVAADIGNSEWGYPYFKRTATIDLTGESKQYVGTLYIGGTHPAANGGAWMAAVLGFAGIGYDGEAVRIDPSLPKAWKSIRFRLEVRGRRFGIHLTHEEAVVSSEDGSAKDQWFRIQGLAMTCGAGETLRVAVGRQAAKG